MQRFDDYNTEDDLFDYKPAQGKQQPPNSKPSLRNQGARYSRRGAAPTVYNGIHRRRQRRIMW